MEVEILSDTGHVISGYAASEAIALRGDSVRHQVRWRGADHLDGLKGRMIALRFSLHQASLYSFWFSDTVC